MHRHIGALALLALAAASGSTQPGQVVPFCAAEINSTGVPGVLEFVGSTLASDGDYRFRASELPEGVFGLVAMSYDATSGYPFGNGNLCLNHFGMYRAGRPFLVPAGGAIEVDVDLPGQPQAGQWHYFQVIHRDTVGAGFNLSGGVAIEFVVP